MIIRSAKLYNAQFRWKSTDASDEYSEFYGVECKIIKGIPGTQSSSNYILLCNNYHKLLTGYEKIQIEKITREKNPEYFL